MRELNLPDIPDVKNWSYFESPKTPTSKSKHFVNSLRVGARIILATTLLGGCDHPVQVIGVETQVPSKPTQPKEAGKIVEPKREWAEFRSPDLGYRIDLPQGFSRRFENQEQSTDLTDHLTIKYLQIGNEDLNAELNIRMSTRNFDPGTVVESVQGTMLRALDKGGKTISVNFRDSRNLSEEEYSRIVSDIKNFPRERSPLVNGKRTQSAVMKYAEETAEVGNRQVRYDRYDISFQAENRLWNVRYSQPNLLSSDQTKLEDLPFFERILPSLVVNSSEVEQTVASRGSGKAASLNTPLPQRATTPQKENLSGYTEFISPYQNYQIERPKGWSAESDLAFTGGFIDVFTRNRVNGIPTRINIRTEQLAGSDMTLEKYKESAKDREIRTLLNLRARLGFKSERSLIIGVNKHKAYRLDGELLLDTEAARTALIIAMTPDKRGWLFSYYADGSVFAQEETTLNKILSSFKELAVAK